MSSPTEQVSLAEVQRLMERAVAAYSRLTDDGAAGPILHNGHNITATDAVRAASALLSAVNLEVFELALWQSWGGYAPTDHHLGGPNA
ncbi:hypothetical protein [Kutzneria sp. NPDC052558]|uniref:hypothetical protein n=1 Tax=Kutzneria sp. NPDC052558 TaxID=3364121 RepID=UPI0037CA51B4